MAGRKRTKTGRPGKLTPEVHDALVAATLRGLPRKSAAALAGVSRSAFLNWLALGKAKTRGPFHKLLLAVRKADATVILQHVRNIQRIALGGERVAVEVITHPDGSTETIERLTLPTWRASAWLLERRFPDQYGRAYRVAKAGPGRKRSQPLLVVDPRFALVVDENDVERADEEG